MSPPSVVPSLLVKNSNVSFYKTLGGLRSLTRVKVFCDLTVNFGEIQHFTRPGTFGTGYTSTQVNLQKTNYTAPLLFLPRSTICQVLWAAPSSDTQSFHSVHDLLISCIHPESPKSTRYYFRLLNLYPDYLKAYCSDLTLVQLFLTASTWYPYN